MTYRRATLLLLFLSLSASASATPAEDDLGLWDYQEGVPGRGDIALRPGTWFSIELQATSPIAEWNGRKLACRQEEEAYLDGEGERHWAYARQVRFHLVR